ncbi:hypothetical protein OGAPHI_007199 [Ogataea philodendri]|uniref:Uncharacterized protein n=1 Tax=Ogataea philodendri TaxID=1378263 RepID=A0A9P8NV61_9ASCO|nr:uncharacterized protein OGAPHI_007199 [Ogataea philodendri]KAH3659994.1 hypothetical protein OGAPHI_007199 [Ogataea philodendri]
MQQEGFRVSSSGIDVDIGSTVENGKVFLPDHVEGVECNQDWNGQVGHEEVGCVWLTSNREQGDPELSNQNQNVQDKSEPRTNNTGLSSENKFVWASSSDCKGSSKSDVTETDGSPGEDRGETGKSKQPVEDVSFLWRSGKETEQTEDQTQNDCDKWSSGSVNVAENLWGEGLLSKRSNGSRTSVDGRVTDRQHGNHDDNVHDRRKDLDTSVSDSNDERRGSSVDGTGTQKSWVVVRNEQTNHGKRDDVEEGDSPEDLLDSRRKRLSWVSGLGSSQTTELGTGKGESSSDKHGTDTLETVSKSSWIVEVLATDVATLWTTTTVKNNSEDDESNDCENLN